MLVVSILYGVDVLADYSTPFTRGVHAKLTRWKRRSTERSGDDD